MIRKIAGGILLFFAFLFMFAAIIVLFVAGTPEPIIASMFLSVSFGAPGLFLVTMKGKDKRAAVFINPYVDVSLYETSNVFPSVNYFNCNLSNDERLIYATPAQTYVEKEQVVGYRGGSTGVSVRVAKGVTLRSSGSKARAVRGKILKFNDGDFIITNRRVIFIGQNDSFEFKLEKITAIKPLHRDAFAILSANKAKNIAVHGSQMKYALGLLSYATKLVNTV